MAIDDNATYGLTGAQVKDLADKVKVAQSTFYELSEADYNWNSTTHDDAEPYNAVALWKLEPGTYTVKQGASVYLGYNTSSSNWTSINEKKLIQLSPRGTYGLTIVLWEMNHTTGNPNSAAVIYQVVPASKTILSSFSLSAPIANLTASSSDSVPLAASQGYILDRHIGDLSALNTTAKSSTVAAINELVARVSALEGN